MWVRTRFVTSSQKFYFQVNAAFDVIPILGRLQTCPTVDVRLFRSYARSNGRQLSIPVFRSSIIVARSIKESSTTRYPAYPRLDTSLDQPATTNDPLAKPHELGSPHGVGVFEVNVVNLLVKLVDQRWHVDADDS